ncbi:MAG: hypothetical protein AB7O24_12445 [Kofleriaceae bacterium]
MRRGALALSLVTTACFDPVPMKGLGCSETDRCPANEICFADGVCGPDIPVDGVEPFMLGPGTVSAISIVFATGFQTIVGLTNVDDTGFRLHTINSDGLVTTKATFPATVGPFVVMLPMSGTNTLFAWQPAELRMGAIDINSGVPGEHKPIAAAGEMHGLVPGVIEPTSRYGYLWFDPGTEDLQLARVYVGGDVSAAQLRIDQSIPIRPGLLGVPEQDKWLVVYAHEDLGRYAVADGKEMNIDRHDYPFVPMNPRLAGTDDRIALVFDDGQDVFFVPIDRGAASLGQPLGTPTSISHADYSMLPNVASDGTSFGVVWLFDRHPGSEHDLYFAVLDETGAITVAARRIATVNGPSEVPAEIVWWPGAMKYVVSWADPELGTQFLFLDRQ